MRLQFPAGIAEAVSPGRRPEFGAKPCAGLLGEENDSPRLAADHPQATGAYRGVAAREPSLQHVPNLRGSSQAAQETNDEARVPTTGTPAAPHSRREVGPSREDLRPELGGHLQGRERLHGHRPQPHRVPQLRGASRPRSGPRPP